MALALALALTLTLALILALALALTWHRALPFDLVMSFLKFFKFLSKTILLF
jgi:hypothetical protein